MQETWVQSSWFRKLPHASQQLSPCATTTEPMHISQAPLTLGMATWISSDQWIWQKWYIQSPWVDSQKLPTIHILSPSVSTSWVEDQSQTLRVYGVAEPRNGRCLVPQRNDLKQWHSHPLLPVCTGLCHEPKNKSLLGQVHWYFQVVIAVVVAQSLRHVQLFVTPWTAACQASWSFTVSQSLLNFMSIELVMPSNHVILCHPFSSYPQSFPISGTYPMSQIVTSCNQSIGASASASVLLMNIQGCFLEYWKWSLIFHSLSPLTCHFYMSILVPKYISNPALSHCLFYHSLNSGPPNLASWLLI